MDVGVEEKFGGGVKSETRYQILEDHRDEFTS